VCVCVCMCVYVCVRVCVCAPAGADGSPVQVPIGQSNITITADEADDTIYYTTDGTTPTEDSSVYEEPLVVTPQLAGVRGRTFTVKALAVSANVSKLPSAVATGVYTAIPSCAPPVMAPASGTVLVPLEGDRVHVTCAPGCRAVFTEDLSTPTAASRAIPAAQSLELAAGVYTLKTACVGKGFAMSPVAAGVYEARVRSDAPRFVPNSLQTQEESAEIRIAAGDVGATILFTLDGSVPAAGSPSTYTCGINAALSPGNSSLPNATDVGDSGEVEGGGEEGGGDIAAENGGGGGRRLLGHGHGRGRGGSRWGTDADAGVGGRRENAARRVNREGRHGEMLVVGEEAGDGVRSQVTVEGCLVTMEAGSYVLNAVAVAPGAPCVVSRG
jgi:hypothetical protein